MYTIDWVDTLEKTLLLTQFWIYAGWFDFHLGQISWETQAPKAVSVHVSKYFSCNALNFQGKIWIIIGMVVFNVKPTKKHFHPLLLIMFWIFFMVNILQNTTTNMFAGHRWLICGFFILVDLLFYKLFKKSQFIVDTTFRVYRLRKVKAERWWRKSIIWFEFVNPRNDWEIEIKPI